MLNVHFATSCESCFEFFASQVGGSIYIYTPAVPSLAELKCLLPNAAGFSCGYKGLVGFLPCPRPTKGDRVQQKPRNQVSCLWMKFCSIPSGPPATAATSSGIAEAVGSSLSPISVLPALWGIWAWGRLWGGFSSCSVWLGIELFCVPKKFFLSPAPQLSMAPYCPWHDGQRPDKSSVFQSCLVCSMQCPLCTRQHSSPEHTLSSLSDGLRLGRCRLTYAQNSISHL